MAIVGRKGWLLAGLAVIVLLVLAYAWLEGGKQPLREISEPVPLPELPG